MTKTGIRGGRWCSQVALVQAIALTSGILTLQTCQLHGSGRLAIVVFLCAVVVTGYASYLAAVRPEEKNVRGNAILLFALNVTAVLFLAANYDGLKKFFLVQNWLDASIVVFCVGLVLLALWQGAFLFIFILKRSNFKMESLRIRKSILPKLLIAAVFVLIFLVGFQFYDQWPRWDSAAYYVSCSQLDVVDVFFRGRDGLVVCGHPAGAYAILVMLAECIPGVNTLNALHLVTIFSISAIYLFSYIILEELIPPKNNVLIALMALGFICSTYALGAVPQINAELLCYAAMLLFLVGTIKNNHCLCLIGCYVACNSRETAVPIIVLFILIQFAYEFKSYYSAGRVRWKRIAWAYYVAVFLVGITWLLLYRAIDWSAGMQNASMHFYEDGLQMFGFGLSPLYIINQLKGIFLTNFTWIYALVILLAAICFVSAHKKKSVRLLVENKLATMLCIGVIAAVVVMCIYVTHHNFRYYTQAALYIQLLGFAGFGYIASRFFAFTIAKIAPVLIVSCLMIAQCFTTIDPIMLRVFPSIDTGNARLTTMPWNIAGYPNNQFLECANYNFQTAFFDIALDKAYSEMDLTDSKVLLYDGYNWGKEGNTANSIIGYGYSSFELWSSWNDEKERRELTSNEEVSVDPSPIATVLDAEGYVKKFQHVYYIELPWGDELAEDLRTSQLNCELIDTVEYGGWVLNVYQLMP